MLEIIKSRMLSNEKFMSKAPEAKVAEEREKLAKYEAMMAQVEARLASMRQTVASLRVVYKQLVVKQSLSVAEGDVLVDGSNISGL